MNVFDWINCKLPFTVAMVRVTRTMAAELGFCSLLFKCTRQIAIGCDATEV